MPLSAVRVLWLVRRPADDPAWLDAPRKRDVIQSRSGDLTLGVLVGIDGEQRAVKLQADGKELQIALNRVAAIGFNTDLARNRRPKGPYYRLTLADGTRLRATNLTFDGKSWMVQTIFRNSLRLPANMLVSVDKEQGKAVWLSDLKPTAYKYHTFDGEEYTWMPNRCVSGGALRLKLPHGESTYDRGIGLHADCSLTYSLSGKYKRLRGVGGSRCEIGH